MSLLQGSRRRWFLALGATAVAAALFASGTFVGRATADEDAQPADGTPADGSGQIAIAPGRPETSPNEGLAFDGGTAGKGGSASGMPASIARCEAPLGDVLSGTTIDPTRRGFTPRFPGQGWTLVGVSFRAQGECNPDGTVKNPALVMDTSWIHDATGLTGHVMQTAGGKATAPILSTTYATFVDGGYLFQVNVNGYRIMSAKDAPMAGNGSSGGGTTTIAPVPPENDPKAREALEALVTALQPKGGLQCFYRETAGTWDDLAKLGIGDPRPAIPAGLVQQELRVTTFTPPAAGCDVPAGKPTGTGFTAAFAPTGNPANVGWLYVNAWAKVPGSGDFPGQVNEFSASWTNADYLFSVGMKSAVPLGEDKIRAIAKLLDPNFEKACFTVQKKPSEGDLAGYGLRKVTVPDGFSITNEWMTATELNANCGSSTTGFVPGVNAGWNMDDKAGTSIQASVNQMKGNQEPAGGFISENHISWSDGKGNQYFVQGATRGINPVVPKELLLQVAKSLDPSLDESKLQTGVTKGAPPSTPAQPVPATR